MSVWAEAPELDSLENVVPVWVLLSLIYSVWCTEGLVESSRGCIPVAWRVIVHGGLMQSKEGTASCIPAGSNSGGLIAGLKQNAPFSFSSRKSGAPSVTQLLVLIMLLCKYF